MLKTTINISLGLEVFTEYIPPEISQIIRESNLDEGFDDENCKVIIVGKDKNKYVGLVAYGKFNNTQDGFTYPRFLHIIITPEYKRTKLAYKMLQESERLIKESGYNKILCLITWDLPNREMKKRYALKFGYIKYAEKELGEYFYKSI